MDADEAEVDLRSWDDRDMQLLDQLCNLTSDRSRREPEGKINQNLDEAYIDPDFSY